MIRLLLAVQAFYPTYSGAAQRFRRYAPGLRARGIELEVIAGTPWPGDEQLAPELIPQWDATRIGRFAPIEVHNGIRTHRVRLPPRHVRLKRVDVFNAAVVRHCLIPRTRPDVVQFTTIFRRQAPFLWAIRAGHIPTLGGWTMMADRDPKTLSRAMKVVWRLPFDACDAVVVNSSAMRERLHAIGVRKPVQVIPNGVQIDRLRPVLSSAQKRATRRALGLPERAKILVTTGSVCPRKAHDLMIKAFGPVAARHPDAHLIILGPRRDQTQVEMRDFGHNLEHLVTQTGAADRIHFGGLVQNIPQWLQAADAFWFSSRQEGLPNAILEAMATGLPVIAADFVGVTPELGAPGDTWALTARDPKALADAMLQTLDHPEAARAMGQRARSHVIKNHDIEVALDSYADLYRRWAR